MTTLFSYLGEEDNKQPPPPRHPTTRQTVTEVATEFLRACQLRPAALHAAESAARHGSTAAMRAFYAAVAAHLRSEG